MKIECIKDKLSKALSKADKMTAKNASLPILSNVMIKASSGKLYISSTNLDLGLEISIPVKILEEGSVCVSSSVITNFISNVFDKNIILETSSNNLLVSTEHTKTVIKTVSVDDFPIIPKFQNDVVFEMNSFDFIKGLKTVYYSASVSSIKPTLSSVMIYPDEDHIVFVSTDGFRLAEKIVKVKKNNDFNQILIPFKNIGEIIKTFEDVSGNVNFYLNDNQICLVYEDIYLVSRVVNGVYPDYRNFVPKEFKTEVVLLKQDLINSLKISNIFADKFSQVYFKISPKDNQFEITTKNMDVGENQNKVESLVKGDSIDSISFNYKYITDCFQSIESDSVSLSFNDNSKPVVIKGVNDKTFLYLVMSMNK